jgi:2-octaprenylphenol hydroxylase
MTHHAPFDIAVVGAGLVGAAAATAFAREGWRVALLEAQAPPVVDAGADLDLRVSAISRGSERLMRSLGAWDAIAPARRAPYRGMVVWDAAGTGEVRFDAADLGEPDLGHIVENRALQRALWDAARAAGVVPFAPATVNALVVDDATATLALADGRALAARLVVAADGVDSRLRTLAGFAVDGEAYDQHAVVAHLRPAQPHRAIAWQRFQAAGPLALLPLADGRCSIVWTTSPEHATALLALDAAAFGAAVAEAADHRLGAMTLESGRARFPLRHQHADRYVAPRLALIGDAAHVVHPLAGQGVNLGFLDAAALAEVLADARAQGDDPGEPAVLRAYERWRHAENEATLRAMDGFKRLFGNPSTLMAFARNAGLSLFDRAGPLKRAVMRRAMGLAGDLPLLVRGR